MDDGVKGMRAALAQRFGEEVADIPAGQGPDGCPQTWAGLARRGSCRRFSERPVAPELIETLCALSLCAPTKSDLQQRDIVIVEGTARARINELLSTGPLAQDWIPGAPVLLVFCGNNRRQRQLHEWRGKPFANDHLDAFFNAAVDAGIALSAFVLAAEAAGLGCACISAIRNHAAEVSELLGLPDHAFPVAGLGLGWPARETYISLRLPLSATVHRGQFLGRPHPRDGRCLRPQARGRAADPRAARGRPVRHGRVLRLVRGQGAPIRRARARGLGRVRTRQGVQARVIYQCSVP